MDASEFLENFEELWHHVTDSRNGSWTSMECAEYHNNINLLKG